MMGSGLLYNPTMKQTNLRAGCKSALQPGTMTDGKRRTQYSCKEVKDKPSRTPNVVFVVALNY